MQSWQRHCLREYHVFVDICSLENERYGRYVVSHQLALCFICFVCINTRNSSTMLRFCQSSMTNKFCALRIFFNVIVHSSLLIRATTYTGSASRIIIKTIRKFCTNRRVAFYEFINYSDFMRCFIYYMYRCSEQN